MKQSFDIRSTVLLQEWGGFIILRIQHWTQINIPFEHSTRYRGKTNRVLHTTSDTSYPLQTVFMCIHSKEKNMYPASTRTWQPQQQNNINNNIQSFQDRQAQVRRGGGRLQPSGNWVSTFLVGKRPVNVCKKLVLSVCDDMRLPLRSMAYGWGWMEGWQ